jgi:hypothetical protein
VFISLIAKNLNLYSYTIIKFIKPGNVPASNKEKEKEKKKDKHL